MERLSLPDGRTLEILTGGDPAGFPWLYHPGSPSAAVPYAPFDEAARAAGLRLVTYSRPGYGGSTPRPLPASGRPAFADDVADVEAILDALGAEEFVTLGWSGGGPRALACAALLAPRCRAATSLAGPAPYDAIDWTAGMAPENVAEYAAAAQGPEAYEAFLEQEFLQMLNVTGEQIAAALGELLSDVDLAALTPELSEWLAATFRHAGAQGVVGVRDDGLAATGPWGFSVSDITAPVAIWQGREDRMVPFAHGEWLAENAPGAAAHLLDGEGHLSLLARIDELLAELKQLGGV